MLRKMLIVIIAVIVSVLPMGYAFAQDGAETEGPQKAVTGGIYSDDDLVFDYTTGVEHITGYDYIYSNPPSSNKVNVTLQNTSDFQLRHFYYYGSLHDCYVNSIMYTGGGFGDNGAAKEISGNIARVRISDSVKNGAGDRFDLILQIKNLVITPDPAYCFRDPKEGVNLFYYQEKDNPIISTDPSAYDDLGTTSREPSVYGRYTVTYEYELSVVMPGSEEKAPKGTLLYGSRDFDSYQEGYEILSGVESGINRDKPTVYFEHDTITDVNYVPTGRCYRICGTVADENTWRSGFAALFDSEGSTLRWIGFRTLGTTIIGQEAYVFTKYYNVKGKIIKGEGSIDPVDVTVSQGMNVNCVIDPAKDYYISAVRLFLVKDGGRETLVSTFDSDQVRSVDPFYMPINNIDNNYRYEVEFEKMFLIKLKVINGIVGDSGSVTEASYGVLPGGNQDLYYSGNKGYVLRRIDVDGSTVSIDGHSSKYSFSNVQSDHNVTVTYDKKYTVETSVTNGIISDSVTVWNGESAVIEYSPNAGYHLTSVKVDGKEKDISQYPDTYRFDNIKADHKIDVVYQANPTLISKVNESGDKLTGAVLQVRNADGKVLDEWTTESDDHAIFGLEAGTYLLTEKTAPEGYLVASDVEFSVDENGKVTVNGKETDKVIMVDKRIRLLPSTGGNGAAFHMIVMGMLITMLSSTLLLTKKT